MAQPPTAVYALLADGTTVEIRPAVPADFDAVKAMHEAMSRDNATCGSSTSAGCRPRSRPGGSPQPEAGRAALLAVADGEVVGMASYVRSEDPRTAEVAFAVADQHAPQGHRHPAARAPRLAGPEPQISTFTAETLTENQAMLQRLRQPGLPVRRRYREASSN